MTARVGIAVLAFLVATASACVSPLVRDTFHPAMQPNACKVLIIKSQNTPLVNTAVASFLEGTECEVSVFTKTDDVSDDALEIAVRALAPQVLVTFGIQATKFAAESFHQLPIVFSLVLNHSHHAAIKAANVAGVAMEPAPLSEFTQFRMVIPSLQVVQILYTAGLSDGLVTELETALAQVGAKVQQLPVPRGRDATEVYRKHAHQADAVWLPNDPIVLRQFESLRDTTQADKVPLLTSLSDSFARAGALMSASVDTASIGAQTEHIVRMVLESDAAPARIGVQRPNATRLVVNVDVAKIIGVEVPLEVLPFINELISSTPN